MTIDVLPTVARLTGADLPQHPIDGLDIWPLLAGEADAKSPHDALYFYWNDELQALRSDDWKMHFAHTYTTLGEQAGGTGGNATKETTAQTELALYNLAKDASEKVNVAAEHPEVVERLTRIGERFDEQLKQDKRPPGLVAIPGAAR